LEKRKFLWESFTKEERPTMEDQFTQILEKPLVDQEPKLDDIASLFKNIPDRIEFI